MFDKPAFAVSGVAAGLVLAMHSEGPLVAAVVWVVGYYWLKAIGQAEQGRQRAVRAASRRYADENGVRFDEDFGQAIVLNPTTGLPMAGNMMGGVDVGGHAWGEVASFNDYSADDYFDNSIDFGSAYE